LLNGSLAHRAGKWILALGDKRCADKNIEHHAEKWEPVFRTSDAAREALPTSRSFGIAKP
jgi:hypothetical protein